MPQAGDAEPAHIGAHAAAEETPIHRREMPGNLPHCASEEDTCFIILARKQNCPPAQRETLSVSSKNISYANNLEKVVGTKAVIKCVEMPWRIAS